MKNHDVIEKSRIYLDLSKGLTERTDLFLSSTDLSDKYQEKLMKLFEEYYSEGYTNSMTEDNLESSL